MVMDARTRRLFWEDQTLDCFEAKVIESSGDEVVLDSTRFFPESGGQPSDEGHIGEAKVVEVREEGNKIVHRLEGPAPKVGETIKGKIDIYRRLDHSCQHTAQHVISAVAEKIFDAPTTGFHLGAQSSTVDIELKSLSEEQLQQLEDLSNKAIFDGLAVITTIQSRADSNARDRFDVNASEIRQVSIESLDNCACCGTHLENTAKIGIIKFGRTQKIRKSTRIEFWAGHRVRQQMKTLQALTEQMSTMTGAGVWDLPDYVKSSAQEIKGLKKENEELYKKLVKFEAGQMLEQGPVIAKTVTPRSMKNLKELAAALVEKPGITALLGAIYEEKSNLVFARSADVEIDVSKLIIASLKIIDGKGGGRPQMAQGGGSNIEKLEESIKLAWHELKKQS